MEHGLKAGIYKISSRLDGSVLTVTKEGRPQFVKTSTWESLDTQNWKVKVRKEGGQSIQIIRNETIKDNEVTKGINQVAEEGKDDFIQVNWKFTPASIDNDKVFILNNGVGFLTSNGKDERISFTEVKEGDASQEWEFEFLSEIIKSAA